MEAPLVSVICPVYNSQEFILDTLNCILQQTYKNLEIIIVDDGSSDNSLSICLSKAKDDQRIKVYHTENGGVSLARNYALQKANGEYITFIDSDDIVKNIFIEKMVYAANISDQDIITCRHWSEKIYSYKSFINYEPKENPDISIVDFSKYRYTNNYAHAVVWAAMFRRNLIQDMKFVTDLYVGEDTFFFAEALSKTKSIAFVDEVFFFYRYRNDSLAHRKYDARQMTEITAWERICELFKNESKDFRNECKTRLGWTCIKNYGLAKKAGDTDEKVINELYYKAKKYRKNALCSKESGIVKKSYYFLFFLFPDLLIYMNNFRKHISSKFKNKLFE